MTTRVLTICGSLQAASANPAALDVFRTYLGRLAPEVEVEEAVDLGAIPAFNPDLVSPGPVVETFRAQLARSDVVVVAAPEYAGGVAGVVKNAFDWVVGSGELYSKPVVVVSAGTSGGAHARGEPHPLADLAGRARGRRARHRGAEDEVRRRRAASPTAATIGEIEQLAPSWRWTLRRWPRKRALERVRAVTADAGIDPGHIAPVRLGSSVGRSRAAGRVGHALQDVP